MENSNSCCLQAFPLLICTVSCSGPGRHPLLQRCQKTHICQGTFQSTWRRRPLRSHSRPSPASCSPAMFQVVLGAPRRLLKEGRESRKLVLVVVFVALLLDNMLLTVVGTSGAFCVEDVFALGHSRQHVPCLISSVSRLKFVI